MSTIRCPRCHRDAPELTAFCAGCGAPLLLRDEKPQAALDAPVELDRRSRAAPVRAPREPDPTRPGLVPPPIPGPAATPRPRSDLARPPADLARSSWDLGAVALAAARPEPAPGNVAVPPRNEVAPPAPGAAPAAGFAPEAIAGLDDLPDPDVDALEVHVARAEPWRRAVAWVVDGAPFLLAGGALARSLLRQAAAGRGPIVGPEDLIDLLARERVIALSIAAAVALALATYATLAHTLAGATLGKRLVGIQVVGPDGGPPSPARSAIRSLLAVLSAALLGLGFLLALFTRTGRALHDLLARTWVVKAP